MTTHPHDNMPPGERSAWANGRAEAIKVMDEILKREEQEYLSMNNFVAVAITVCLRHRIADALRQP